MIKPLNNYAFIDNQNIFLNVQALGWKIDWEKFRIHLAEKYSVKVAYQFLGYIPKNKDLYEMLKNAGYNIIFKPVSYDREKKAKGNVDCDLALQIMFDFHCFDEAVVVSSDGDFYSVVEYLNKTNKLSAVLSPNHKKCSRLLREAAEGQIDYLDSISQKVAR